MEIATNDINQRRDFYDRQFRQDSYAAFRYAEIGYLELEAFVEQYGLKEARILDVGCGRGWYANIVPNWIGLDISLAAGEQIDRRFICGSAEAIPLADNSVDAIWTITFLEHSREPEVSLSEMVRVLKDGGLIYLAPAWRVPPWRAKGYEVKDYRDLKGWDRVMKIILPAIDLIWQKGLFWVPLRLLREFVWAIRPEKTNLFYVPFEPNMEEFLTPDSDACSSIDNHDVLLWFMSRGFAEASTHSCMDRVLLQCRPLILVKKERVEIISGSHQLDASHS